MCATVRHDDRAATARRDDRAAVGWAWTGRNLILDEALPSRGLCVSDARLNNTVTSVSNAR